MLVCQVSFGFRLNSFSSARRAGVNSTASNHQLILLVLSALLEEAQREPARGGGRTAAAHVALAHFTRAARTLSCLESPIYSLGRLAFRLRRCGVGGSGGPSLPSSGCGPGSSISGYDGSGQCSKIPVGQPVKSEAPESAKLTQAGRSVLLMRGESAASTAIRMPVCPADEPARPPDGLAGVGRRTG